MDFIIDLPLLFAEILSDQPRMADALICVIHYQNAVDPIFRMVSSFTDFPVD